MTVEAHVVRGAKRIGFLPRHFGKRAMLEVEERVYQAARVALPGYQGGVWEYVRVAATGYMRPTRDMLGSEARHQYEITGKVMLGQVGPMGNKALMSLDAAGLALTVLAVNYAWHRRPTDYLLENAWRQLMEVVHDHEEAVQLRTWLD